MQDAIDMHRSGPVPVSSKEGLECSSSSGHLRLSGTLQEGWSALSHCCWHGLSAAGCSPGHVCCALCAPALGCSTAAAALRSACPGFIGTVKGGNSNCDCTLWHSSAFRYFCTALVSPCYPSWILNWCKSGAW